MSDEDMPGNNGGAAYTGAMTAAAYAHAEGTAKVDALGVVATAARIYGTALALAEIRPRGSLAASLLTPGLRFQTGVQLLINGNYVLALEAGERGLEAVPAVGYPDGGSWDRSSWLYQIELSGPGESYSVRRRASDVLHFMIESQPARPWRGTSPLERAGYDSRFLAHMSRALSEVTNAPHGYVVTDGAFEDDAALDSFVENYRTARGRAIAMTRSVAAGQAQTTLTQFGGHALRLDHGLESHLDKVVSQVSAATGVHPSMLSATATGTTLREAWRELAVHLEGVAEIIVEEIRMKLDESVTLDFTRFKAPPIRDRASAYAALVKNGMDADAAAKACGF